MVINLREWLIIIRKEKEIFYLTTHSTHFINGYCGVRHNMVKDHLDSMGYTFRLPARVLLFFYMHHPTDRMTHTAGFCYTSRREVAGTRNSSMSPP